MSRTIKKTDTRKIASLATDGFHDTTMNSIMNVLKKGKAVPVIVAAHLGEVTGNKGTKLKADESFLTTSSVLFDAVYVVGGKQSIDTLLNIPEAVQFLNQAYNHFKPIGINGEGIELFHITDAYKKFYENSDDKKLPDAGIIINKNPEIFLTAVASHRFWNRQV